MNPKKSRYSQIRLILGDQLNLLHSWFKVTDENVLYVLMEIKPESEYVTHHIQKIVGIFLNMRNFAAVLQDKGHHLKYYNINDEDNLHSFQKNLQHLIDTYKIKKGSFMEPDEYRLDESLEDAFKSFKIPYSKVSSEHFLTDRDEIEEMFPGKSTILMENFYRKMREKHQILMDEDKPAGNQWNYDKENRNKLPKNHNPPELKVFHHDVSDIIKDIEATGIKTIGNLDSKSFLWPANRQEALDVLDYFLTSLLIHFGTYQDAMSNENWSLYHSRLSFALNIKLISPKEVIEAAENHWKSDKDAISLAQVEGFIRQILGWREYMRGIYWKHMPEYERLNYFNHQRSLPSYFWTGTTKMNCIHNAVNQSLDYGYAHHIQRLMVTGNFCLLTEIDPDEVDNWYLGIYIDAFQWVEITNTRGMSQYADGGIVGTKPYVSSASYINKMSDYCSNCHYNHKKRTGEQACPFNSLYWRFLNTHKDQLATNPRMSMMYRLWDKMDNSTQNDLTDQANFYLDNIEDL